MTRTLDFLKSKITYFYVDGHWWFPVKQICEAIGVDYRRQKRRVSSSRTIGPYVSKQTHMLHGDTQPRKHICIAEQRVYIWLAGIRSNNADLHKYQMELADMIFEKLKGSLVDISAAAVIKREAQLEMKAIERELATLPQWQAYQKAKSKSKLASNRINKAVNEQGDLFSN